MGYDSAAVVFSLNQHHQPAAAGGLLLSWPNINDTRRSQVAKSPSTHCRVDGPVTWASSFVHLSSSDVEIHYRLISQGKKGAAANRGNLPSLSLPLPWNPHNLETADKELLQYFRNTASQSLATLGHEPVELGNVLLRLCMSNGGPPATALLRAILAFSSLHLHGNQMHAWKLKISSLEAMVSTFSGEEPDARQAIYHIASNMLLYSCEIQHMSCTSGDWTKYIYSVKEMLNTSGLGNMSCDSPEVGALLDWVCYSDVMARFSLRHYEGEGARILSSPTPARSMAPSASVSAIRVLELLLEIYSAVSRQTQFTKVSDEHRNFLKILDWKIRILPITSPEEEVFHLATLIYLGRTSGTLLDEPLKTQKRMERAFSLLSELPTYVRQFPVFILGCEASTDKQRCVILDLISRSAAQPASRSFNYVKLLLEAIWAQDDLNDGCGQHNHNGDYWTRLDLTMRRCTIAPSFV